MYHSMQRSKHPSMSMRWSMTAIMSPFEPCQSLHLAATFLSILVDPLLPFHLVSQPQLFQKLSLRSLVLGLHLGQCLGLHLQALHRLCLLCLLRQYEHQRPARLEKVGKRAILQSRQHLPQPMRQLLQPILNPRHPPRFRYPRKLLSSHKPPKSLHREKPLGESRAKLRHPRLRLKQESPCQRQLQRTCPKRRALLRRTKLKYRQLPRKSRQKSPYGLQLLLQPPRLLQKDSLQASSIS